MYGFFKDAEEAKRFMDWRAGNAFKITSQETKTDKGGKAIEYRSELILDPEHSSIGVMWVGGNAARWIIAKDREDALELERYYRRSQAQPR